MITKALAATVAMVLISHANAAIDCITTLSKSVTTPDYHCSKHCGDWAATRPLQSITLEMDKKFKDMGAFFSNASSNCTGAGLCGFSDIPKPSISSNGEVLSLSFKTWSRPVVVTISADICIFNKSKSAENNNTDKKQTTTVSTVSADKKIPDSILGNNENPLAVGKCTCLGATKTVKTVQCKDPMTGQIQNKSQNCFTKKVLGTNQDCGTVCDSAFNVCRGVTHETCSDL